MKLRGLDDLRATNMTQDSSGVSISKQARDGVLAVGRQSLCHLGS
jgi:hypothetical protein